MKNPRLQVMLHGPGIGSANKKISVYNIPCIVVSSIQKVKSPNYLF
jgi:hypothetical protein